MNKSMNRRWWAVSILLVGNFVTILDLFIVNVAIPSIQTDLSASDTDIQFVIIGYAVAYGVFLMNGARLGDLFGRRRLFLTGLGVFTIASGLCGMAMTPMQLIIARVIQGLGAALLMPQVLASIKVLFEDDGLRRKAFGVMGAVQGGAAAVSQLIGGFLMTLNPGNLGWRMVFLINLPVGIVALIAGRWLLIETKAPVAPKLDAYGAILGTLGLLLILIPIMEGHNYGWPWWSYVMPLLALFVFRYFVRYERQLVAKGGVPIFDMTLFSHAAFSFGLCALFLFYSAISSFFLSLTLLLQPGLGLSPLMAGVVFTPSAIAFFIGALLSPKLAGEYGDKALLGGVLIFIIGLVLSAGVGAFQADNYALLIVSLILNGLGQGIVIPLAINTILSGVDNAKAGMGSGALATMQTIGTSCGVAIVGMILFSSLHGQPDLLPSKTYGHALAYATIYNVVAAVVSLILFASCIRWAARTKAL